MGRGGSPRGRGEWDQALPELSDTEGAETACVSECWSLRLGILGELQARNGVVPSLGRRVGRERSSDQGDKRCAIEEGVSKEASATPSLRDLGRQIQNAGPRPPHPPLLPPRACRYLEGRVNLGEDCLPVSSLLG